MNLDAILAQVRVASPKSFSLKHHDPAETFGIKDKEHAAMALRDGVKELADLQERLYAQNTWALLVIFQAMDAAGKDSTIKHVMSGVNPQGCQVYSFKQPSSEELDHDFLWRTSKCMPERGRIGIFNRSYYEEVLVVRVHPQYLAGQRLPPPCIGKDIWKNRFSDINGFEKYLANNGVVVRKFFLNVSREEQRRRFLERLEDPAKNWKFSHADVAERGRWDDYMHAYQECIRNTSTEHAPWHVIPADHKWITRMVVAAEIVKTLRSLKLEFPRMDESKKGELLAVEKALKREKK